MGAEVRFDDIEGLKGLCSEEFSDFGPSRAITQEMVNQFAELTGDHQWIHVDPERCKAESPFGGPIVHGFFVLSMLAGLKSGATHRVTGAGLVVNYGAEKLRFVSPVPVGKEVHLRSRLVDATAKPKGTMLTTESEIHVVGAGKPSVVYRHLTLFVGAG